MKLFKRKKIKLYIHIGQPKTGTSAIQGFLNHNQEQLILQHGILYPNFNNEDVSKGLHHNHSGFFLRAKLNNDFASCINTFNQTIKYCYSNTINKIIYQSRKIIRNSRDK